MDNWLILQKADSEFGKVSYPTQGFSLTKKNTYI